MVWMYKMYIHYTAAPMAMPFRNKSERHPKNNVLCILCKILKCAVINRTYFVLSRAPNYIYKEIQKGVRERHRYNYSFFFFSLIPLHYLLGAIIHPLRTFCIPSLSIYFLSVRQANRENDAPKWFRSCFVHVRQTLWYPHKECIERLLYVCVMCV